jgi:hypothetical protein
MPDWNLVSRSHVVAAMQEYDRLEAKEFHRRYGLSRARFSTLWHQGNEYPTTALLGVAYLHATGRSAVAADLRDGEEEAVNALKDLGFDVVVDELELASVNERARRAPARTAAPRASTPGATKRAASAEKAPTRSAPAKKRVSKPEVAPKICPTCYTALPATGICDFCD